MAPGVLLYRKSNVSIPSKQQAGSLPQKKGGRLLLWLYVVREKCKRILRQYRIILSADTASEVRQMPSQKRR